jgi:hypothetical protein
MSSSSLIKFNTFEIQEIDYLNFKEVQAVNALFTRKYMTDMTLGD